MSFPADHFFINDKMCIFLEKLLVKLLDHDKIEVALSVALLIVLIH